MKKKLVILGAAAAIAFGFGWNHNTSAPSIDNNTTEALVVGTNVGEKAPEISMNTPDGKTMNLSDFKGQMVLIDFWASWCGPCRRENPNVVRAYNKYQDAKFKDAKGFTVLSVSLDKNADSWNKAISQDNLVWKNHVSDLQGWKNAAAQKYGVSSIPMSFLIDENGVIVAKNLRGQELDRHIDQYVKSFK
ncbi:MAG: TlpA disulfide reductase family protein [Flavobacteriales bacterium]|nr:TlpA disulfide reductase family protein [Flavobacteriales bacterium]MDG1781544.1 TlpA disulfide reductase family protein [Flavobacteriales bacterium]MDG2245325.1 TlpA disulfide reductase family protein [Flavobacteriales bacterium]